VGTLVHEIRAAFPEEWIFTPTWKDRASPGVWPSIAQLRDLGARLFFVSRRNYGTDGEGIIFYKCVLTGITDPIKFLVAVDLFPCFSFQ
jgi:hypothetical protein